jgi:uncharacterized RDD family membrane protein YckC
MNEIGLNPYRPPASPTPDVPSLAIPSLADRLDRFVAAVIDFVLFGLPVGTLVQGLASATLSGGQAGVLGLLVVVVGLLQCRLLYERGQTIGKLVFGIRIVRRDGRRAELLRLVLLRDGFSYALRWVPVVGVFLALLDALMIFRSDRRCLHDLVADTIVVIVPAKDLEVSSGPPPLPPEIAATQLLDS